MDLEEIREHIIYMSGSGKNLSSLRRNGIYSTFTLEGLDDMKAVRDTAQRFDDFGIPEDLKDTTFLDIGCNVGAMAFEAIRRGAILEGIEYRHDRVALCRTIASYYRHVVSKKFGVYYPAPLFYQVDLNEAPVNGWESPWNKKHDIVICCSVDEYIDDLECFYSLLYEVCGGTIYLESNRQKTPDLEEVTLAILERHGFKNAEYLGNGHSGGISRKRKLFKAEA